MARSATRSRTAKGAKGAGKRPWWKRWWVVLLVLPAVALGAVGLLLFFVVFSSIPLPDDIAATASMVYDVDGEEVGNLSEDVNQEIVDFDQIPEHTRQAVMAAEDRGFYDHNGISATGIARALFTNVRGGGVSQGGSTITQQYIKNAALSPEQTYTRKVREAALAIKLERAYEKDEILGFYMNSIYWGRGAIGIQSAAQVFFDTTVDQLDVNQSAMLAGIIAAPEAYDPLENPERADQRRVFALGGMLEEGWIDQATHDELVAAGLPEVTERRGVDPGPNAYYLDAVRRVLTARPEFQGGELFRGLRVHTQLDPRLQAAAQEELARAVDEGPTDTGAIVTLDPRSGGVRALVGGPDAQQQSLNTALVSPRQPGSTFKAFTLQAFTEAGFSPETRFPAPAEIDVEGDPEGATIQNFGGTAYGEQTVYQATASSTNTVYYQMQEEAGRERVIEAATRAGLPEEKRAELYPTDPNLRPDGPTMEPNGSLTLGSEEFTPLEMASAFGTYAAEGVHSTPHLITRVEDADGDVVWEQRVDEEQDVDLNVARVVTAGLEGVISSGSGTSADIGRPAAGKTGTTSNSKDAWFVGYVPQLVTSVWLGNLDNTEIEGEATGGGLAAPLWGAYMARAVEDLEVEDFVAPDLGDLEGGQAEQEASCPEGYEFAEPPTEADEDGFFPDVLTDVRDDEGRPCVEIAPEPEPECPEGFAFADPPSEDADPQPEVLDDITDDEGRPCVETDPEPEPEETEPTEPEPTEPEPTEPDDDGLVDGIVDDGGGDDGTTDDGTTDDGGGTDDGTTDDGTTDGTTDDGTTDGGTDDGTTDDGTTDDGTTTSPDG